MPVHDDVREASGIAASRVHENVLWLHNDSEGGASVFAVSTAAEPLGRITLQGAHNRDWEDIAVAPCPRGGPQGDCLFVADIGDNRAVREAIGVWIAPEPEPRDLGSTDAVFVRLRYPDGQRDAEAIAVLPDGSALIVSKGREHPVSVYRTEPLAWPDSSGREADMRLLQRLAPEPVPLPDQITGASADEAGLIALRSYATLQFYRLEGDTLAALLPEPVRLDPLGEPQGEGVALGRRGRVYLASEAGPQGIAPRLTPLKCRLP